MGITSSRLILHIRLIRDWLGDDSDRHSRLIVLYVWNWFQCQSNMLVYDFDSRILEYFSAWAHAFFAWRWNLLSVSFLEIPRLGHGWGLDRIQAPRTSHYWIAKCNATQLQTVDSLFVKCLLILISKDFGFRSRLWIVDHSFKTSSKKLESIWQFNTINADNEDSTVH